jgi:hypothetical protein
VVIAAADRGPLPHRLAAFNVDLNTIPADV